MSWLSPEYVLKGLFLGLLLFTAVRAATPAGDDQPPPGWPAVAQVTVLTLAGLAAGLGAAAYRKVREGYRAGGRLPSFLLFLALECPRLVYAGLLGGLALAALSLARGPADYRLLTYSAAGGALLGVLFGALHGVGRREVRLVLGLVLAAALVVAGLVWLGPLRGPLENLGLALPPSPLDEQANLTVFAVQILLGIPAFYLLTLSGTHEETEVEIAAVCAALGLGLAMLTREANPGLRSVAGFLPVVLYFLYTMKVLPGLRVFKHALRGHSYLQVGRQRQALLSFRRALQLDPNHGLARQGYWQAHCRLDPAQLSADPQTLALLDFDLCLDRVGSLLVAGKPTPERAQEAGRLLDLVASQRPDLAAPVAYWRAVALAHAGDLDGAAARLAEVVAPPAQGADHPRRLDILYPAWNLALVLHEGLRRRVGQIELGRPGRRMEAIAAVERHMAGQPDDAGAWNLKRMLYQDVTEAEYEAAAPAAGAPVACFDHAYAQQLGLALISDADRWQRGGEYLRLAARGLPQLGPSLFVQIGQAYQRHGDNDGAWRNYQLAKQAGRAVGPKNLPEEERQAYFATLKALGDAALKHGKLDEAVEDYVLYTECERSGVETLRTLAGLYEQKGDALAALRVNEQALVYSPRDPDLLDRKDRYYYSVMPDFVRRHRDQLPGGFDVGYCLEKARTLLNARELDPDALDWAYHLADLAAAAKPESLAARVLLARARLRRGERDEAAALLDEVRAGKPEKFAGDEDEEAWFTACRLLGDLCLNELGQPELAVACYNDYRKSSKSGADTLYKLGQAHEALGDRARAAKCYELVTAYEGHPLAYDARQALYRVQEAARS